MTELMADADAMSTAAKASVPFDDTELDLAIVSLQSLAPAEASLDWEALRALYGRIAHRSHKDWAQTGEAAAAFAEIVGSVDDPVFRKLFARVLDDGNWNGAAATATARSADSRPWVVLVTGLNGIRKTSSIHSLWFQQVLKEALGAQFCGEVAELPSGQNSFFRQLDYMIATLAVERFKRLYTIGDDPAQVDRYSEYKAGIFARYRTVAETLGVHLVREAQARRLNIMVETSGRDVGMYQYIDTFFPDDSYRKLVVNFSINDLSFAERSVDARMLSEMRRGQVALARAAAEPARVVDANAGGPYGSQVLGGVQSDSQRVWTQIVAGVDGIATSWLKASIEIEGDDDKAWRARAAVDGAQSFEFAPPADATLAQ